MLSNQQADTIVAALRFWSEEIVPHGLDVAQPYFDSPAVELLSKGEIEQLATRFAPERLLAVQIAPGTGRLIGKELLIQCDLVGLHREYLVLTVIPDL